MSLNVFVRSPDTYSERRFDPNLTIGALKAKLESITGIPYSSQVLYRFSSPDDVGKEGAPGVVMQDDGRTLAEEGVTEWECISVTNINPNANPEGEFTDVSRVDKYEISQDEYEKRNDTVLQDLKARGLGRFAPPSAPNSAQSTHHATPEMIVGKRCIVRHLGANEDVVGDEPRGTIEFVGRTEFGKGNSQAEDGDWVGVKLDEPTGKNDGSPERIVVGEWPEIDEFADEEDEDEI
ncbi:hypothetical protein QFC22_003776 [Naganishia vaughanmartiniae]|uniref:Uncharacterized protein n=1 Tax=Naganishia vaughanmartiniae TaxID=1424756 RepID=A0ACC2X684_9TREE|nr:hypothetical protein QFC22_003776 [Naganishia vaughanmartiniae]